MEKQKRWHLYLILIVVVLTVYNILPTVFYYAHPLKKPIHTQEATEVARGIVQRVNSLEDFTLSWLKAQSKNLGLKPTEISLDPEDPKLAKITFHTAEDASFFAQTLYRAGSLIPFIPAQLYPDARSFEPGSKTVIVQRKIGVHLNPSELNTYFHFIPKTDDNGMISPLYRQLINDRVVQLALGFGGESQPARIVASIAATEGSDDDAIRLARTIVEYENAFGDQSPITQRYFASFTQLPASFNKSELIHKLIARLENVSEKLTKNIGSLREEQSKLQGEGKFLSSSQQQKLEVFENQKNLLEAASSIVKRNVAVFTRGQEPLNAQAILHALNSNSLPQNKVQKLNLGGRNPFILSLSIDWNKDQIQLNLQPDVAELRRKEAKTEIEAIQIEKLNQFLFNDIASVSRSAGETITPHLDHFAVTMNKLTNSSSLLAFDIGAVAKAEGSYIKNLLSSGWQPANPELNIHNYPIYSWSAFEKLPNQEKKLGLVMYAPAMETTTEEGFRGGSFYVIARGLNTIRQKYQDLPASPEKEAFERDFRALYDLMRQNGFIGYSGASANLPSKFHNDFIFELDDYYSYLLAATREDFSVKGGKKMATLEFTDVEQRLLTLNKIETREHEDLLKWRDEYHQARVGLHTESRYDVPRPTKNILLDNFILSAKKYVRGDERKILKWGLDLSGGKTVRIGLKDQNNHPITNEDDLKQAVNELYSRVNRLGVSEIGIRTEGFYDCTRFSRFARSCRIRVDSGFAMYFHVVNEKFTAQNALLKKLLIPSSRKCGMKR